jgi:hypothetical protein
MASKRKKSPSPKPRKKAAPRKPAKRGSGSRWFESNWFLLLIAVVVVFGVRYYRSSDAVDQVLPETLDEDGEDAPPADAVPAPPTSRDPVTVAVHTGAHGSDPAAAIGTEGHDAVLKQTGDPGEIPPPPPQTKRGDADAGAVELAGEVTYRGMLMDEVVVPSVDRQLCEEHPAGALRVIDGELADALVWVEGLGPSATSDASATVTVRGCQLQPRVVVVGSAGTLTLVNDDPVAHPLTAGAQALAPLAPADEPRQRADWPRGLTRLGCDRHPWEESWVLSVDHPHAAVTDVDGRFHLGAVPMPVAGTLTLHVFHPVLGTFEQAVFPEPGRPMHLQIDLSERAH